MQFIIYKVKFSFYKQIKNFIKMKIIYVYNKIIILDIEIYLFKLLIIKKNYIHIIEAKNA